MGTPSWEGRWDFHSLDQGVNTIAAAAKEFPHAGSKASCENLVGKKVEDSNTNSSCDICGGAGITVRIRKTGGAGKVHFGRAGETDGQGCLPEPGVRSTH